MYKILHAVAGLLALTGLPVGAQITETAVTVAPGWFLLEVDALSVSLDREPGMKYTAFGAATTFLTTGITDNWDIQVGAEFYLSRKFETGGVTDRRSGVGDAYVRTKWRFYESADTYTSVAVMPYVKFPTNSGGVGNEAVEGGLIIPLHTELIGGFHLDTMGELNFRRNDDDDGYDAQWFASAALGRKVLRLIGLYGEATVAKSSGGRPWEGMMGLGATLDVGRLAWWDYAIYRGISSRASDRTHVLRFNWGF